MEWYYFILIILIVVIYLSLTIISFAFFNSETWGFRIDKDDISKDNHPTYVILTGLLSLIFAPIMLIILLFKYLGYLLYLIFKKIAYLSCYVNEMWD